MTTDIAAPEFNFDVFMYGVRRDAPFDGSTLSDSIADAEVHGIEAAFNSLLKRAEAAEARVKELEKQNQRAGDFRRNETISALQRAEAAESRNGVLEGIIARKEFDAPKGEQVPVGKFVFEPSGERWHHIKHGEHQHAEPKLKLVKLFTAPQKPVVLPTLDEFYETSNRCVLRRNIIKAIEAAGGIVKDGE